MAVMDAHGNPGVTQAMHIYRHSNMHLRAFVMPFPKMSSLLPAGFRFPSNCFLKTCQTGADAMSSPSSI